MPGGLDACDWSQRAGQGRLRTILALSLTASSLAGDSVTFDVLHQNTYTVDNFVFVQSAYLWMLKLESQFVAI